MKELFKYGNTLFELIINHYKPYCMVYGGEIGEVEVIKYGLYLQISNDIPTTTINKVIKYGLYNKSSDIEGEELWYSIF